MKPLHQQLRDALKLFGQGQFQRSAELLQALAAQSAEPGLRLRAHAEWAKSLLAAGRATEARSVVEQALALIAKAGVEPVAPGLFASNAEHMRYHEELRKQKNSELLHSALRPEFLVLHGLALEQSNDTETAIARYREARNLYLRETLADNRYQPGLMQTHSEFARPYLAAALIKAGKDHEAKELLQAILRGREDTLRLSAASNARRNESVRAMGMVFGQSMGPMPDLPADIMSAISFEQFALEFVCPALAGIDLRAGAVERALETAELCRGRALAGLLAGLAFPAPPDSKPPSRGEIEDYARTRKLAFERASEELWAQRIADPRALAAARPSTVADMRRLAAERSATIVYYQIDRTPSALPGRMPSRETGITIWVVAPDGRVNVRQRSLDNLLAPGTLALTMAALRLGEAVSVPARGVAIEAEVGRTASRSLASVDLRRFHQLLIEPVRELLPAQEGARLIVVPEGALFLVPFAALEDAQGTPLIARHALSVVPSLQTLALTALRRQPPGGSSEAVVVGNPLMPRTIDTRAITVPALPDAQAEANAIAALLKTSALSGAAATKRAVLARLPTARYVHLATHGYLETYIDAAPVATNPHVRSMRAPGPSAGGSSIPGLLALAPEGNDEGWLTADEIAKTKTRAELVVLSACDTGRGLINDDGVIGLSRAWIAAGAPSVVVSLWQIPDDATRDLMVAFYQQLAAGTRKAEALRLAMLETRKKYPQPFNWAAFTLIGEPD
ncbi:MAG: CHAT domain-containing protein [Burkholderiales bacterium]